MNSNGGRLRLNKETFVTARTINLANDDKYDIPLNTNVRKADVCPFLLLALDLLDPVFTSHCGCIRVLSTSHKGVIISSIGIKTP